MNPRDGVWYGLAFDTVLFGALALVFWLMERRRQQRRRAAHPAKLGLETQVRARMRRMAQPTLLLRPAATQGFSKMGGPPEASADVVWPSGGGGPLLFVAQIDLDEVRQHAEVEWLPDAGRLYFFYDPGRHGLAEAVCVTYSATSATDPAGQPEGIALLAERRVGFARLTSLPSLDWIAVDTGGFDEEAELETAPALDGAPQHRIGGYPDEIQNGCLRLECEHLFRGLPSPYEIDAPPAVDRASREWRLLMQIDSDDDLGLRLGDAGRLFVFVRRRDAVRGDFSKTVTIYQTH